MRFLSAVPSAEIIMPLLTATTLRPRLAWARNLSNYNILIYELTKTVRPSKMQLKFLYRGG